MVTLTIASLVISTTLATHSVPNGPKAPLSDSDQLVQNEITIDGTRIDPTVTGQTNADTVADWERRQKEMLDCKNCVTINPYPADLED